MTPPNAHSHEVPDTLGPFRVLHLLGVGGMGSVYLGERMEQFSQQVAIKILHPHLFPQTGDVAIEQEGRVLAELGHPGIVRMLDLGLSENGLRYIVMEYVDGVPLDVFCDKGRLSVRRRAEILLDVLDALEYAHRHLVIHADLKPENILVTPGGKPRLLDFGVAMFLPGHAGEELGRQDEGSYTALFASPEQRSGERLTVASDLYSVGLIARLVLAGIPPKELPLLPVSDPASSSTVKALKNLGREALEEVANRRSTSSSALLLAISGDLDAIVAKSLQRDPADRFQSAGEMRDEFERHLLGYPIHARSAGWFTRTRKWILRNKLAASFALAFLVVVALSAAGVILQATDAARKREIAKTRLQDLVRLTDVLAGELYDSVHGLPGSDAAQSALLDSAHRTIDALAADDVRDPQLEIELAREYEKLALLEFSRNSPAARLKAVEDLNKGIRVLGRLSGRDSAATETRKMVPEMVRLRDAAEAGPTK